MARLLAVQHEQRATPDLQDEWQGRRQKPGPAATKPLERDWKETTDLQDPAPQHEKRLLDFRQEWCGRVHSKHRDKGDRGNTVVVTKLSAGPALPLKPEISETGFNVDFGLEWQGRLRRREGSALAGTSSVFHDTSNPPPGKRKRRSRSRKKVGNKQEQEENRPARLCKKAKTRASLRREPPVLCRYFLMGRCLRGDDCTFRHEGLPVTKNILCAFYRKGLCLKGDACPYGHSFKLEPCRSYLMHGTCRLQAHKSERGRNACPYSHEELSEEEKKSWILKLEMKSEERLQFELSQSAAFQSIPTHFPLYPLGSTSGVSGWAGTEQPVLHDALKDQKGCTNRQQEGCTEKGPTGLRSDVAVVDDYESDRDNDIAVAQDKAVNSDSGNAPSRISTVALFHSLGASSVAPKAELPGEDSGGKSAKDMLSAILASP